jgi:hypothetical protein
MADLVVSYVVQSRTGTPYGHRIWSDGTAEGYQVSKPVRRPDGSFEYQSVHPDFYPVARLSAAQVEAVRSAVESSRLAGLPENVRSKGTNNSDADSIDWQLAGNDGVRTVHVAPWPPANDEPVAALTTLVQRIGAIILAAQSNSQDVPA